MAWVSLADLVAEVDASVSGDPLDRVDVSMTLAAELADRADALVDHYVLEARRAGRSWTEIGARLGVSKQAARKRFAKVAAALPSPVLGAGVTLRPRLQACLDQAAVYALGQGAAEVGTQHLLAGLLHDGVGAAVLDKLGVTVDGITTSAARLFGPPAAGPDDRPSTMDGGPPLSADAVCAVEAAAHHARARAEDPGTVWVGTEHLLFVLAMDRGSRARRVLADLGVDLAMIKKELACYVTGNPPRTRRFGRPRRTRRPACSFCGTVESSGRPLVHGPDVRICAVCAERAAQNLHLRADVATGGTR